jgi:glycosyltransferase involved in cell wall biosynthesis
VKLLYVHETLGSLGGAEANVHITATELKQSGWDVGLLYRRRSGRSEPAWDSLFSPHLFLGDPAAALATFQPDVIYVHKWDDLAGLEALLDSGIPAVRMVHDHDIYCLRSYKYHVLSRKICRRPASPFCVFPCLAPLKRQRGGKLPFSWQSYSAKLREIETDRRFSAHFVVTEYMRHELEINRFERARIEIFPPVPRPAPPLTSNFSERNLLVYAGQIIRGKGVDVMLESLARVKHPFELIILGDGHHKPTCEKLTRKLGLQDRVRFAGFIPQDELRQYYAEASAVLIPSVWPEPIATVGLEVMRFGLPVIAFDAGGISDWLTDNENGRLIPWMDREAFAAAVDGILGDKSRAREMGENGRIRVNRDYDFNDYIARLGHRLATLARGEGASTP